MGSDLSNAKTAIRWGTDYLLKATTHPGTIYLQVGDPNNDHKCWERPEDLDTSRTAYKIDSQNPGSDVSAETDAALAGASLVFRKTDPSYSKKLIHASIMSVHSIALNLGIRMNCYGKLHGCIRYNNLSVDTDTFQGLLYLLPEVNLQYVMSASFVILTYAKYLSSSKQLVTCGRVTVTPRKMRVIAKRQVCRTVTEKNNEVSKL
ncbi:hypothetical protein SUGI_1085660 [Cryptomeria japonica]|nr:hypothetical protein SUGI_1085660 [Cryptomeria japonica]